MKKLVVVAAAMLLFIGANAQVGFGVKAGGNASFLSKATAEELGVKETVDASKMIIGFHAGAFANLSFGEFFGLQPEILYSAQGGKYSADIFFDDPTAVGDISFKLSYINVPVMFEVKPATNFSILVGPQIGLLVGKKMVVSDGSVDVTIKGSELEDEMGDDAKFNSIDFSAAVGAQYTIANHFVIGARYNIGFNPFMKSTDSSIKTSGWANNTIQLSLGYKF